jgi:hypothetical protein
MADKLYIKLPGGAIIHHADGGSEYYAYGQEVDLEVVADHAKETIDRVADSQQRVAADVNEAAREVAAEEPAAKVAVPGNYDELDEDEATSLVAGLPVASQIEVVKHEILHKNRTKVLDAASPEAREAAGGDVKQLSTKAAKTKRRGRKSAPVAKPEPAETPEPSDS